MRPGSPEWAKVVTASKVAAILGVSPFESPYSMWAKMRGGVPAESEGTDVQKRGHYLEPAIIAWWRDQHHEVRSVTRQPTFTRGDWAAATPDALAYTDLACTVDDVFGLVEAKSVRDTDDWGDPGTDVIPAYYLVQVYWQMHVSGVHRCYVPVIGPFLDFCEYVVEYDPAIGADLETRMRAFYDTLQHDTPPNLDGSVSTWNVIRKMHADIDKGVTVELSADQAREYVTAKNGLKDAEARERLASATVLDEMGRAQYADHAGQRIARRQPNRYGVQLNQVAKTFTDPAQEGAA